MMPTIVDQIMETIKEYVTSKNVSQITFKEIISIVKQKLAIPINIDDVKDVCKMAWNLEEEYTPEYSLEAAVRWFRANIDKTQHSCGCLYMEKKEDFSQQCFQENEVWSSLPKLKRLHLLFFDKNDQPLLDCSAKHKIVSCYELDERLAKQFGDKNMLLLK